MPSIAIPSTRTRAHIDALRADLAHALHCPPDAACLDFTISALTEHNPTSSTAELRAWLHALNREDYFAVERIPLTELRQWSFHPTTGDLEHATGGFFSIRGLSVRTNIGTVPTWSQPVIHQPEIGVLGIITKVIDGILYLLVQAKPEPGNVVTHQLSPTVQATRSNYERRHGGKPTRYLEYFLGDRRARVLVDQLQSEQGARFYCKRNRNMIVRLRDDEDIEVGPYHRWATLGQLHALLQEDNLVNMDTRSVISEISFAPERVTSLAPVDPDALHAALARSPVVRQPVREEAIALLVSSHPNAPAQHTTAELLQRITQEKFSTMLERSLIPLRTVTRWRSTPDAIAHEAGKYFRVIGVRIHARDREVTSWDQPIIEQQHAGIVGFITKHLNGVLHVLVQLKMESGVMDLLELAPTVQCITDNYTPDDMPRFTEHFLHRVGCRTLVDAHQSEEGGRFFHETNHNIILLADATFPEDEPPFYCWMTLHQIKTFLAYSNFINVEARSLLACLRMT